MINWILLIILGSVGGYDLWLVYRNRRTLSQQYQRLYPKWVDMIMFILGIAVVCAAHTCFPEVDFTIWAITLAFWGHITFANKETYEG